jgi:hypothetical protein
MIRKGDTDPVKSLIDLAQDSGKGSNTVPQKGRIRWIMAVGADHGAVDPRLFSLFYLLVLAIGDQDPVDNLPGFGRDRSNVAAKGRLLESFINNPDTTEPSITDRVEKMESQFLIAVAFHLLDDCRSDYLLRAHPLGATTWMCHRFAEILQDPLINDRVVIKNFADAFQFPRVRMVDTVDHEGHLFLILFAHFLVAPFFAFAVILIGCTPFITTWREI